MAAHTKNIETAQAGQIVGISGLDKYVSKSCTVTSSLEAHRMRVMKFNVSPVVRVAVEADNAMDRQRLHEGLKRLVKSDPCAQFLVDAQTNQTILCGAGELHLEVCINSLRSITNVELRATEPVVQYCETVTVESPVCLAKSSNKHNRIYMKALPLSEILTREVEEGTISMSMDAAARVARLADVHGWHRDRARKIMSISGSCILVDATQGINIGDIRDNVISSFSELVFNGPMAGEPLRGVCFEITDAKIHADSAHRRPDQICPATRSACFAAMLSAQPRFQEPLFAVDIQVPDYCLNAVCKSLKKRKGEILDDTICDGTPLHSLRAYLPVAFSFGFSTELRSETSGRAFPQCGFSHWQLVDDDPCQPLGRGAQVVRETRARKNMSVGVPPLETYLDTM